MLRGRVRSAAVIQVPIMCHTRSDATKLKPFNAAFMGRKLPDNVDFDSVTKPKLLKLTIPLKPKTRG